MDQYLAATESCALADRSDTGKLALTGGEAKALLNGQVSNEVETLAPGLGVYATLLTAKGKMLADLRVLDRGDELLLLCERAGLQALFDALRRGSIGWDAQLHKRTVEMGLMSLIGPAADEVLGAIVPAAEHANVEWENGVAIRTDTGIDVVVAAAQTASMHAHLVTRGAIPAGAATAEIIRVEHGRPRYGIDLDDTVIPQEAGLNERAVSFTKGCYVGQETVARLHWKGRPNRHLRGLRLSEPVVTGAPVLAGERLVGRLGSVAVSPRLGPIALALLRREVAPGDEVTVGGASASVAELPFHPNARRGDERPDHPPMGR